MGLEIRELDMPGQRGVNMAAALTKEQLKYATEILDTIKPGHRDPVLLAALIQAMAINYAATCKA